jgi:hypothetical protein
MIGGLAMLALLAGPAGAAPKEKGAPAQDRVLSGGRYSAKVKAIVCGGCADMIFETLSRNSMGADYRLYELKTL